MKCIGLYCHYMTLIQHPAQCFTIVMGSIDIFNTDTGISYGIDPM